MCIYLLTLLKCVIMMCIILKMNLLVCHPISALALNVYRMLKIPNAI